MVEFPKYIENSYRSHLCPPDGIFTIAADQMPDITSDIKPTVKTSPFDRLCQTTNDETVAIRYQGSSQCPSEIIATAITASDLEYKCRFVTQSQDTADDIMEILRRPVWKTTNNGASLLTDREPVMVDQEKILIWPSNRTKPRWWLDPAGKCHLKLPHQTLCSTKPEQIRLTLHQKLPCVHRSDLESAEPIESDEQITVETSTGELLTTYDDRTKFRQEWNVLYDYLLPTQLHYCDITSVWYLNGSPAEYKPSQDNETERSEQLTSSIAEFLNQFTIPDTEEKLYLPDVFDRWIPWHTTKYPLKPVEKTEFAEIIKTNTNFNINTEHLKGRSWVYPT